MNKWDTERLVLKLPENDVERNEWLIKNGASITAQDLRVKKVLQDLSTTLDEKVKLISDIYQGCNGEPRPVTQAPAYGGQTPKQGMW